jgi:cell division protein ZapA
MESVGASIEIMGKTYQVKCPKSEINSLQRAAQYLQEKMLHLNDGANAVNVDKIAIVTALNIVHQLLMLEQEKSHQIQNINRRLHDLQSKVEGALAKHGQLELEPTE